MKVLSYIQLGVTLAVLAYLGWIQLRNPGVRVSLPWIDRDLAQWSPAVLALAGLATGALLAWIGGQIRAFGLSRALDREQRRKRELDTEIKRLRPETTHGIPDRIGDPGTSTDSGLPDPEGDSAR